LQIHPHVKQEKKLLRKAQGAKVLIVAVKLLRAIDSINVPIYILVSASLLPLGKVSNPFFEAFFFSFFL
jgi:hypothetical protein